MGIFFLLHLHWLAGLAAPAVAAGAIGVLLPLPTRQTGPRNTPAGTTFQWYFSRMVKLFFLFYRDKDDLLQGSGIRKHDVSRNFYIIIA
uniref:Uncharacterized protein n=1 Tax=Oryza brachyantha TaxID=4533 RepID=J3LPJ7_ORYBR